MKKLTLILSLIVNLTVFSQQTNMRADLLIPFNDKGSWGWCDTLGNIIIQPNFSSTGFFYKGRGHSNESWYATVYCKGAKNEFVFNEGLLIPKKYAQVKNITYLNETGKKNRALYVVQDKKARLGIYHTQSQNFALKCSYDSIYVPRWNAKRIYLKKENDEFFSEFNPALSTMKSTDIVEISNWTQYVRNSMDYLVLFKHTDGSWTRLKGDTHMVETFEKGEWEKDATIYLADVSSVPENNNVSDGSKPKEALPDKILYVKDFSRYPKIYKKYGFKKLIISRKNGRVGMATEKDSIVIPYNYDDIAFSDYNATYVKLIQDGKEGVKLIFSSYPIIEAKYDKIKNFDSPHNITVNDHWSFMVFKVQLGEQDGYVGENGVEYFQFKE